MAEVEAWALVRTSDWAGDLIFDLYLGGWPLGSSLVGVTNWASCPVYVLAVCRTDYGRRFRDLPGPVAISPGRMAWFDMNALLAPSRYRGIIELIKGKNS